MPRKSSLGSKSVWLGIIALIVALGSFFLYQYNSQLWAEAVRFYRFFQDPQELKVLIASFGAYSPLVFIVFQMLQVVVAPIPGAPVEFLGGYLFGTKLGFIYSMIGLGLGSLMAFSLARIFEKWAVEKLVSPKIKEKFDYLIGHEGVIISLLLFLIPGFPKDALCFILGLTPMHMGIFLATSTVGRTPGALMASMQGSQAFNHHYIPLFILLGISGILILVFYIYHEEIHKLIRRITHGL